MTSPATRPGLSIELIVDTALQLIAKHGADRLSMRQLSAELGVSLGATYRHVPSKEALLTLCGRALYERAYTSPAHGEDPLLWVREQVMHLYDLLVAHPGMATRMTSSTVFSGNVDPELQEAVRRSLIQAGHSEENADMVGLVLTLYTAGALMASGRSDAEDTSGLSTRSLIVTGIDFILHSYAAGDAGAPPLS